MKAGPRTLEQFNRLGRTWKQGEHAIVIGGTGSGKTTLARYLDQLRINRGGHVVVFVAKLSPDETITRDYKGWTRWTKWKKNPAPHENKILLWPEVEKVKGGRAKVALQKEVFGEAIERLFDVGKWTVHFDEGLYMSDPKHLGFASEIAMLHAMGRSSKLTLITLAQRPSHLPLIIYSSASHAFIGRSRERADLNRLSELGGKESSRELASMIDAQGRHDFLWVPVAPDWPAENVNLKH